MTNESAIHQAAEEIDGLLAQRLSPTAYLEQSPAIQEITAIISRHFPSVQPVEEQKLTNLQRAMAEHDNDMARLDRNTLQEKNNERS